MRSVNVAVCFAIGLVVPLVHAFGDEPSRRPPLPRLPFELHSIVTSPSETANFCRDLWVGRKDAGLPPAMLEWLKNEKVMTIDLSSGYGIEVGKDRVTFTWDVLGLVLDGGNAERTHIDQRLLQRLSTQEFQINDGDDSHFPHSMIRRNESTIEEVRFTPFCSIVGEEHHVLTRLSWRHSIRATLPRITYRDLMKEAPCLTFPRTARVRVPDSFFDALSGHAIQSIQVRGKRGRQGITLVIRDGSRLRSDLESLLTKSGFTQLAWDQKDRADGSRYFLDGPSTSNCQTKLWTEGDRLGISVYVQLPDDPE